MLLSNILILSSIFGTSYQTTSPSSLIRDESNRSNRRFHMGDEYGIRPIPIPRYSPFRIRRDRNPSIEPISEITQHHKNVITSKKKLKQLPDHINTTLQEYKDNIESKDQIGNETVIRDSLVSNDQIGTTKDTRDSLKSNDQIEPVKDIRNSLESNDQIVTAQETRDIIDINQQVEPVNDTNYNLDLNQQIEPVQVPKQTTIPSNEDKIELDDNITTETISPSMTKIGNQSINNPMKIPDPENMNYVRVNLTSPTPLFIPFDKTILLDPDTFWTGDKLASKIDPTIYHLPETYFPPCLYPNENEPGTCLIKSHEGFYLTGEPHLTEPFDCLKNFKTTVKTTVKFDYWSPSFDSPLTTSQLITLIRPPLRPAPRTSQITFKLTCPVAGRKVIQFQPLLYKLRGISYNEAYLSELGSSRGHYQDIHFPVLASLGIVHGLYSVLDYESTVNSPN